MTLIDIWTEILMREEPGLPIWEAQELAEQHIINTYTF